MYAKILLITAFILSGETFAQGMPSSEESLKYLKDHFSATYHGEYYFVRRDVESANEDDHAISDIKIMHNPTLIYKPNENWQVLATGEFKYSDQPAPGRRSFINNYFRSLFTVTRKNLLVEKEHGLKLDAGVGRRDFNNSVSPDVYGNYRAFATLSKTYGAHSGSLFVQYLYNDPKKSTASTWEHGLELIPTINIQLTEKLSYMFNDDIVINTSNWSKPGVKNELSITHDMNLAYLSYTLNDKFTTYYQFKYYHSADFTDGQDDYFEHYVGVTYTHNKNASVTFELGSDIIHASDSKSLFSKKASYPELAIYLDLSL